MGFRAVGVDEGESESPRTPEPPASPDILRGSIESPPSAVSKEPFDVMFLSWELQRAIDPGLALDNARSMLKPGGLLFADVPNHGAYTAKRLGPAWYSHDAGRFLNFFTSRSLTRSLESKGFAVVDLLYHNYTVQFRKPRLVIEQELWDRLYEGADLKAIGVRPPRRKSGLEQWRGLLGSMFRGPSEMYEVAGIVGRKVDA